MPMKKRKHYGKRLRKLVEGLVRRIDDAEALKKNGSNLRTNKAMRRQQLSESQSPESIEFWKGKDYEMSNEKTLN